MVFVLARLLVLAASVGGMGALAADPKAAPAGSVNSATGAPAQAIVADAPPTSLDPVIVNASKMPGFLGDLLGYNWNISECTEGSNFHIRNGELIDAIGFRHLYLQQHPTEKAAVVVITSPTDHRVTQAVVAYTAGPSVHLKSIAIGDIRVKDLTPADVDRPDVIRKYVQEIRETYLGDLGSVALVTGSGQEQEAIDRMTGKRTLVTTGALMAVAEETGDYSRLTRFDEPLYRGSSDDMLVSAFYWLNSMDKVGLVPVARSKIDMDISHVRPDNRVRVQSGKQDAVVFDLDGVHYLYNDQFGTLGMPLPKNPITGAPYLVLQNGDLFESLYFTAVYAKQHPDQMAALIPAMDGIHAAAAFGRGGKLWVMSPFLGRFTPPPRYRIDQVTSLAQLHETLVERELKKLPPGTRTRPVTGLPQAMPGDSTIEQVRRAYLSFKELGLPVKFVQNDKKEPGLQVDFRGATYSYFASGPIEVSGSN